MTAAEVIFCAAVEYAAKVQIKAMVDYNRVIEQLVAKQNEPDAKERLAAAREQTCKFVDGLRALMEAKQHITAYRRRSGELPPAIHRIYR